MAEELWQAYDEQGNQLASAGITKLEARKGALHGASHLWIWRKKNDGKEILLQKRANDKLTWPGYLDISAAGHIDFKESPLQAIIRETKEELGLEIQPSSLRLLFMHRQHFKSNNIIENEFQWVYGLELKESVRFQFDDEVDSIRWIGLKELKDLINRDTSRDNIVPHGDTYFTKLFKEID